MIYLKVFLVLFFFWPMLLILLSPKMGVVRASEFAGEQLLMWWCQFIGFFLLIRPCLKQMWVLGDWSTNIVLPPRRVSQWAENQFASGYLNAVHGQPEDGVSAEEALVRDAAGNPVPYRPGMDPRLRAYLWNQRNSVGRLKFALARNDELLVNFWFFGARHAGWKRMPQIKGSPCVPVLG